MKDNFYLTLPSNSSFEYFPGNKTTNFTTQLPQRISLSEEWERAVVEFHYPRTFLNVNASNNIIYYGQSKGKLKKYKLPVGNYFASDIIEKINTHPEISFFLTLQFVDSKIKTFPVKWKNTGTSMNDTTFKAFEINEVTLSPNLALQLGFNMHDNLMDEQTARREPAIALGVPNQIYLYCDVTEPQYVGDTCAPLLRIIHVDQSDYIFGTQMVSHFDSPHYVSVLRKEFETIEIDLRTDTGSAVPFLFGTCCCKLHFRKTS